jgi:hypothetical protein
MGGGIANLFQGSRVVNQPDLIPDVRTVANGDAPRDHPTLILPKVLDQAALNFRLPPAREAEAHRIVLKWAKMDDDGRLDPLKETRLRREFLTDFFIHVLGYAQMSDRLQHWDFVDPFGVNGGEADAAIGRFWDGGHDTPRAVIEMKGPRVNLDRDRSGGRTPVQQLSDYLTAVPDCPWGILTNYVSFRLYHRNKTMRAFELFKLQDLRSIEEFRKFYVLFSREGLLPLTRSQKPLLDRLLEKSENQQREVGEELYKYYADQRRQLIECLMQPPHAKALDAAIRIAQKLIDRIVFVAFCEDRGLLPENCIERIWSYLPLYKKVTHPRWQNFKDLFRTIDQGYPEQNIPPFNGGLFAPDPELDNLDLTDDRTEFFRGVGRYDFAQEVNEQVLGHLFERSINDLERIRAGGLFGEKAAAAGEGPKMEKSAERKRGGIYYTPREFTDLIVRRTVGEVIRSRMDAAARANKVDRQVAERSDKDPKLAPYWRDCFEALRTIKVCDPACGSGAFLFRAYEELLEAYDDVLLNWSFHDPKGPRGLDEQVPAIILRDNLYGVDLSREAAEITQLALWIRSARPGKSLADLSRNIVCGNSLVTDPAVDGRALDWRQRFADVFSRQEGGFDCVIGNPPWERMKLQEREFFDVAAPEIASAVSAATRRKLIEKLAGKNPELYARYEQAKEAAEKALDHVRSSGNFPLTGTGDINTYMVFAELARRIVSPAGRVGILVPSGIATDHTTRQFFGELMDTGVLGALYDFENKAPIFPDVHRSFKFCVLLFGGAKMKSRSAHFVFFARKMKDLDDKDRHIALTGEDLKLLNPNTRTCPIFRSRRDAEITKAIYRRIPILINDGRKKGGNPWGIRFLTMFHQTNDAELFRTADQLKAEGFKRSGAVWRKGRRSFLPLHEAKMVQAYDHRAASVVVDAKNWMRQGQTESTSVVEHQNPEFLAEPRWWVDGSECERVLGKPRPEGFIGFKDITSPTNQRTMIAAGIAWSAATNHLVLVLTEEKARKEMCLLANLNAHAYDYVARQKIGGITLNFFIVEQLPTLPPEAYAERCPWNRRETLETWISERVLKLTCTADDMRPLAKAAGFDPPVHKWKDDERADIIAELDAAYFILYGIERDDAEYILSTFAGSGKTQEGLFDGLTPAQRILQAYDRLRTLGEKRS